VFETLDQLRPEKIINLIALTSVDECEKNPNKAILYNVRTLENIVAWIKEKSPETYLIHISSDHVYNQKGPHREDNVDIINTYANTKYYSEQVASEVKSTILRTNFFGLHRLHSDRGFWNYITRSLKNNTHFSVSTEALFSPLYISTFCTYILTILKNPVPGVFNLGSRGGMSKGDFVKRVCELTDMDFRYMIPEEILQLHKSVRPEDMRMDCSAFEEAYNVQLPELEHEIEIACRELSL
jgi:dTDP-4-dehydrorhamnose reductase